MTLPKGFKPNLAGQYKPSLVSYPVEGSPKIDGFRVTIFGGVAYTRSLKTITNEHIQKCVKEHAEFLEGMDCEITVGPPNDSKVFENTSGAVRRRDGKPDFTLHIFDHIEGEYDTRIASVRSQFVAECVSAGRWKTDKADFPIQVPGFVKAVEKTTIRNEAELDLFEEACLKDGYEGAMIKGETSHYKFGRSTPTENGLIKIKRREDCEIFITGFEEEKKNNNVATTNELGRTARSSHKENKVGKGTLGNILGVCLNGSMAGSEVSVGSGFTADQRKAMWEDRSNLVGQIATIQFFPVGCKDSPRHPVFLNTRDPLDQDEKMRDAASKVQENLEAGKYDHLRGDSAKSGFAMEMKKKSPSISTHEDFGSW